MVVEVSNLRMIVSWKIAPRSRGRAYDQSFAKRAQHQRNRLHHCLTVVSRRWIHLGEIQGTPPQIWEKSGGIRFLSVHSQSREFRRIQSERFPAGNALLS